MCSSASPSTQVPLPALRCSDVSDDSAWASVSLVPLRLDETDGVSSCVLEAGCCYLKWRSDADRPPSRDPPPGPAPPRSAAFLHGITQKECLTGETGARGQTARNTCPLPAPPPPIHALILPSFQSSSECSLALPPFLHHSRPP